MKNIFLITSFLFSCITAYSQVNFNNQVLVYFKTGVTRVAPANTTANISSSNVLNILSTYGIPAANVIPSFPNFNEADTVHYEIGESSRQMNRAKVFTITVTNSATKNSFIAALNNLSEVLYAESNGTISNNIIPIDGRFGQQWGLRNTVVPNADIHADPAWDIFTGNPNAIIAIIDNGVDVNHDDLDTKILGGDNNFEVLLDDLGRPFSHGSHVAGIAAAITNNGGNNGVAGVDWAARIHSRNIFDGNGDPDITQSIIDAVNFNQNVWTLNNSWGTLNQDGTPGRYSVTIRSAFAHAYRNNRVSCIAMGNHHPPGAAPDANDIAAFPASINSGVIAVGATNINDGVTGFSARGPHIDVAAPGNLVWSTNFNDNYIDLSGTSMATPHVAGLASLLKGFNTNLANDDIEQIIRLSADDVNAALPGLAGFDNQMGTGRINAERALQFLQAPNTVQHLSVTGGTVFSTSADMTRIFLGVPGLADAAYIVRRSEVRRNVTFPAMCNIIGVWGRGVGTTGLREENGRSFGEGICEIVPGTLTATGATLRTWIYEVWNLLGQRIGFFPQAANNVVFQYTILGVPSPTEISGDNSFCTTSNSYAIPNLPTGATVTWSASPWGAVTINTPNDPTTTVTKNYDAFVTLTATIANACGSSSPVIINKNNIRVGNPPNTGPIGFDTVWPNGHYSFYMPLSFDYPSPSYVWKVPTGWTIVSGQYTNSIYVYTGSTGGAVEVETTICGIKRPTYKWVEVGSGSWVPDGGGGTLEKQAYRFTLSPNPAESGVTVAAKQNTNKATKTATASFSTISISDITGVKKKVLRYAKNTRQAQIDVSNLRPGTYIIEITDGTYVERQPLVIQK